MATPSIRWLAGAASSRRSTRGATAPPSVDLRGPSAARLRLGDRLADFRDARFVARREDDEPLFRASLGNVRRMLERQAGSRMRHDGFVGADDLGEAP